MAGVVELVRPGAEGIGVLGSGVVLLPGAVRQLQGTVYEISMKKLGCSR